MFKKVRDALAAIDNAAADMDSLEREDLWAILTAMRGPDERAMRDEFKQLTTTRLRAITIPFLADVADVNWSDKESVENAADPREARDDIAEQVQAEVATLPRVMKFEARGVTTDADETSPVYPHFENHIISACKAIRRNPDREWHKPEDFA